MVIARILCVQLKRLIVIVIVVVRGTCEIPYRVGVKFAPVCIDAGIVLERSIVNRTLHLLVAIETFG